jgi:hypothetical protein
MEDKKLPGEKKRISQQFYKENRDKVYQLAMLGCTDDEICSVIRLTRSQLRHKFEDAIWEGRGNLRSSLRKAQIETAIRDRNPTMLIWLGKNYLGQKEPKQDVEHSGGLVIEAVTFGQKDKNS